MVAYPVEYAGVHLGINLRGGKIELHNFFFSLLLLIRCILSLSHPGFDSWWQNIFNSVLFKKACERERIHLKIELCATSRGSHSQLSYRTKMRKEMGFNYKDNN